MENELEVVNIRLVKEPSLYSEQTLDSPQAVVELMAKELSQYDREVFCILNMKNNGQVINMNLVSVGTINAWIILHMTNCNASFSHRKQYITPINRAFGEKFQNMDEFKEENNFKRCLKKMDLSNVIAAVDRARKIMQRNQENGYTLYQYKGYQYYKENPSLAAWEAIEKILKDCELV